MSKVKCDLGETSELKVMSNSIHFWYMIPFRQLFTTEGRHKFYTSVWTIFLRCTHILRMPTAKNKFDTC